MNLAIIILWLALRGLAIAGAALVLRLTVLILRKIYGRVKHAQLMRPKNVYFTL